MNAMSVRGAGVVVALAAAGGAECIPGQTHPPTQLPMSASPNQSLLDEVTAARSWFHARKTRPIGARLLEADQTIQTLEGPLVAKAGDFLCRGEQGELWPQARATLEKRYVPTDIVSPDGWRTYQPRPDAEGVYAAQVPHAFEVVATWGTLHGKAGDYVLKNFRDGQVAYPEDVWIVDRQLFNATYQRVVGTGSR